MDGGLLLAERHHAQAAADAAALAAAVDLIDPTNTTAAKQSAKDIADANGYLKSDTAHVTVTVNIPPKSGNFTDGVAYPSHVEAIVQRKVPRAFSAIFGSGDIPVTARAVARWSGTPQSYWTPSILALGTGKGTDLTDSASAITVPGEILVNAGLSVSGSGKIKSAADIDYVGSLSGSQVYPDGATSPTPPKQVGTTTPDPLSSISPPAVPSAPLAPTGTGKATLKSGALSTNSGVNTIYPGSYTSICGGAVVTMQPGIYYIEGGGMTIQGTGTKVTGTEVMFYNGQTGGASVTTGLNQNTVGQIQIKSSADVEVSPISTGVYQGISIFQDRNATAAMTLSGGGNTYVKGMIYAASSAVTISGRSTITPGTSFISKTLTITGGSDFTIPTAEIKVPIPGSGTGGTVGLVE